MVEHQLVTLAIDFIDRHGPSNKMRRQSKLSQRRLSSGCINRLYSSKRRFSPLSFHAGGEAFKRRLVHSVALTIMA